MGVRASMRMYHASIPVAVARHATASAYSQRARHCNGSGSRNFSDRIGVAHHSMIGDRLHGDRNFARRTRMPDTPKSQRCTRGPSTPGPTNSHHTHGDSNGMDERDLVAATPRPRQSHDSNTGEAASQASRRLQPRRHNITPHTRRLPTGFARAASLHALCGEWPRYRHPIHTRCIM